MAEKLKFEDIKNMLTEKGLELSDLLSMARIRPPQDPFSVYDLNGDGGDQDAIVFAVKKGIKGRIFGMLESKIKGYVNKSTDSIGDIQVGDGVTIDADELKSDEKEVTTAASITLPVVKLSYKKKTAKQDARAGIKKYVDSLGANVIIITRSIDDWALADKPPVEKEEPSETQSETETEADFVPMKLRPDPEYKPEEDTIQGDIYFSNNPTPPVEKDRLPYEVAIIKGKWTLMEIDQQVYLLDKKKMEIDKEIIDNLNEFDTFKKDSTKWKKVGNLNYYAYEGRETYPEKLDPDALFVPEKYAILISGEYDMESDQERTKLKVKNPYDKYVIFPGDGTGFINVSDEDSNKKSRIFYKGRKVDIGDLDILKKIPDEKGYISDLFKKQFDYEVIEEPELIDEEYTEEAYNQDWKKEEQVEEVPVLMDPVANNPVLVKEIEKANEEYVQEKGDGDYSYLTEPFEKFTDVGFWLYLKHQRGAGGAIRLYRSAIGDPMPPAALGKGARYAELAVPLNHFTSNWTKGQTPTGEGPGGEGEKSIRGMYYGDQRLLALTFIHKLWLTWLRTKDAVDKDFKSGSKVQGSFDRKLGVKTWEGDPMTYGYIYDETVTALKILKGKISDLITVNVLGQFYMIENGLNVSDAASGSFDSMLQIQGVNHAKGPMTGPLLYDTGNNKYKVGNSYKAFDFRQPTNQVVGKGGEKRYVYYVKSLLVWYLPRFDQDFKSFTSQAKFPITKDQLIKHPFQK